MSVSGEFAILAFGIVVLYFVLNSRIERTGFRLSETVTQQAHECAERLRVHEKENAHVLEEFRTMRKEAEKASVLHSTLHDRVRSIEQAMLNVAVDREILALPDEIPGHKRPDSKTLRDIGG